MNKKLDSGGVHVVLGEGTNFYGLALAEIEGVDIPVGVCFKNSRTESSDTDVVVQFSNHKGVASYMMALVAFLEKTKEANGEDVGETILALKNELLKLMPEDNTNQ